MEHPNIKVMEELIAYTKENFVLGSHAVGAFVVKDGEVIARAMTTVREDIDSTCHAEINVLRKAYKVLNSRTLSDCYLYTTYEPCPMCTTAAIWSKMKGIVYGASREDRNKNYPWRIMISAQEVVDRGEPKLELHPEFMREECKQLLLLV